MCNKRAVSGGSTATTTIDDLASFATSTLSTGSSSALIATTSVSNEQPPPEIFGEYNMPISSPETKKRCIFNHNASKDSNMRTQGYRFSCSSLPTLLAGCSADKSDALLMGESSTTGELDLNVSPAHFINNILQQSNGRVAKLCGDENIFAVANRTISQDSYFITLTEDQKLAYNSEKVSAVQNNDVDALRVLLHSGDIMQTSNRFGESLLHTACRRGFTGMVQFFLYEAGVCPRVRDDMGRTPMHDACWASCAPNHTLMKMLIAEAPEMLLTRDVRGHSPFDYARREHWPNWVTFLNENRQFIVNCFLSSSLDGESVSTHSQSVSADDY